MGILKEYKLSVQTLINKLFNKCILSREDHATAFSLYMCKRREHFMNKNSLCIVVGEENY